MKSLLKQLHTEVFVLDSINELPAEIDLPHFACQRIDTHTIEVTVNKGQQINVMFAALSELGIEISSMRNRSNRLEELFVNLLNDNALDVAQ